MKTKIPNKIRIRRSVIEQIKNTVGQRQPETGGALGGNRNSGEITEYFFDEGAYVSGVEYRPNRDAVNTAIRNWPSADFVGIVHSHPRGVPFPSGMDISSAISLFSNPGNDNLRYSAIPIVQSSATGPFSMTMFVVDRSDHELHEIPITILDEKKTQESPNECFSRISSSVNLERLADTHALCIGCGGSAEFITDLARSGFGRFCLIDPDRYEHANLATQACFRSDVGTPKVESIAARIQQINADADVHPMHCSLDDLSDDALSELISETTLVLGMTDSFHAQARTNQIALKWGIPSLCAQVYRGGYAAEVTFTHPETTLACHRCILSSRYDAFLKKGIKNHATSEGSQYVATPTVNSLKLWTTLALAHHGSGHSFWGDKLAELGNRNLALIQLDPNVDESLGIRAFKNAYNHPNAFTGNILWREQFPENPTTGYNYSCPDCGGTGNLKARGENIPDTKIIPTCPES